MHMQATHTDYVAWLKDAHAMELALITTLEKQIKDTKDRPDIQAKLSEHLDETRSHAQHVESCIIRNGGDTSTAKDLMVKASAALSGFAMSMVSDAMVKNIHSAYAAEHFEIASYLTIRAAAEGLGDTETIAICDEILEDEYEMAEWVEEQIPLIVTEHIEKTAKDKTHLVS